MKKIAIIMGSDSDLPIVEKGISVLKEFNVPFEVHIYSAHRTPIETLEFAKNARDNGFGAIISAAGMAAHLGGVIASQTTLPVIGIPIESGAFKGLDSLLSTVQMPSGIPVATVAVNGAQNACLLAIQMLAIEDKELQVKLDNKRLKDKENVLAKNAKVENNYNI
ncbi:MAG: 5-(carboxyamino)imidazole ribonucleotide mutase [Clostridia bacterium]|nr:5-(carboxyamino)imidazole ribonucleotide mutase [Clostridia bacterium]